MKKLLKKFQDWKQGYFDMEVYERGYDIRNDTGKFPGKWRTRWLGIQVLCQYIHDMRMSVVCYFKGHDMECNHSHGGPDSGSEDFECQRCGYCQHISYY